MGKGIQKEDVFLRMNYLYQAAHTVLAENPENKQLVRFYCNSIINIAKKNVLRLDLSIKRTLCKKCWLLLLPGVTCRVRHKSKRQKHTIVKCVDCGTLKRFNTNSEYKCWTERSGAWLNAPPKIYEQKAEENSGKSEKNESTASELEQSDGCVAVKALCVLNIAE